MKPAIALAGIVLGSSILGSSPFLGNLFLYERNNEVRQLERANSDISELLSQCNTHECSETYQSMIDSNNHRIDELYSPEYLNNLQGKMAYGMAALGFCMFAFFSAKIPGGLFDNQSYPK